MTTSPPSPLQAASPAVPTQYEDLLRHVMEHGTRKTDRTGTGTRSVFGHQMRFDLSQGFPLVTTKRVHLRSVVGELLWFLRGESTDHCWCCSQVVATRPVMGEDSTWTWES